MHEFKIQSKIVVILPLYHLYPKKAKALAPLGTNEAQKAHLIPSIFCTTKFLFPNDFIYFLTLLKTFKFPSTKILIFTYKKGPKMFLLLTKGTRSLQKSYLFLNYD